MIGNPYSIATGGAYKDADATLGNALSIATDGYFLDDIIPTGILALTGESFVGSRSEGAAAEVAAALGADVALVGARIGEDSTPEVAAQ